MTQSPPHIRVEASTANFPTKPARPNYETRTSIDAVKVASQGCCNLDLYGAVLILSTRPRMTAARLTPLGPPSPSFNFAARSRTSSAIFIASPALSLDSPRVHRLLGLGDFRQRVVVGLLVGLALGFLVRIVLLVGARKPFAAHHVLGGGGRGDEAEGRRGDHENTHAWLPRSTA